MLIRAYLCQVVQVDQMVQVGQVGQANLSGHHLRFGPIQTHENIIIIVT